MYPVDPTPGERIIPYPASPKWNHVGFQSVMNGIALPNIALPATFPTHTDMPVELSGSMDEHPLSVDVSGPGRAVVESHTGIERSLKAWESSMVSLYNADENAMLDSVLYMPPNAHSNHFTVIPERYTLTSSFALSFTSASRPTCLTPRNPSGTGSDSGRMETKTSAPLREASERT